MSSLQRDKRAGKKRKRARLFSVPGYLTSSHIFALALTPHYSHNLIQLYNLFGNCLWTKGSPLRPKKFPWCFPLLQPTAKDFIFSLSLPLCFLKKSRRNARKLLLDIPPPPLLHGKMVFLGPIALSWKIDWPHFGKRNDKTWKCITVTG